MLVELQYMRSIPRNYRKLHIVRRFNEYFDNFFLRYPFSGWQFSDPFLLIRRKKFSDIYKALQFLICLKYSYIHVRSKNSSFSKNVIVTTSNFVPNHVTPCGTICPHIPLILILYYSKCNFIPSSDQLFVCKCHPRYDGIYA